jgi:AcrR family transcriptional regulator
MSETEKRAGRDSNRATYRHGNVRADAVEAAYRMAAREGHEKLSLRQVATELGIAHRSLYNHFADRDALLDAVATEAFDRLAARLKRAVTSADFARIYARYALKNRQLYGLMTSRPHATMKDKPELQDAVHRVISEAMRVSAPADAEPGLRRRAVMKDFILMHGGLSLFAAGILDLPSEAALIDELSAMIAARE